MPSFGRQGTLMVPLREDSQACALASSVLQSARAEARLRPAFVCRRPRQFIPVEVASRGDPQATPPPFPFRRQGEESMETRGGRSRWLRGLMARPVGPVAGFAHSWDTRGMARDARKAPRSSPVLKVAAFQNSVPRRSAGSRTESATTPFDPSPCAVMLPVAPGSRAALR